MFRYFSLLFQLVNFKKSKSKSKQIDEDEDNCSSAFFVNLPGLYDTNKETKI